MGYGKRALLRIREGICIDCQMESSRGYRRCRSCRERIAAAARRRYAAGRRWRPGEQRILSYTTARERGLI